MQTEQRDGSTAEIAAPRRRGRQWGAAATVTRKRIVRAARDVVGELGYDAATFGAIAVRAGVTRPAISYYFTSTGALLRAVVEDTTTAMIESGIHRAIQEEPLLGQVHALGAVAIPSDVADRSAAGTVDLIYRAGARGASCWARNHRGHVRDLPMTRWIGGPHTTRHDRLADERVLGLCSVRPTLDVGCGPGRFTASLQQRGCAALGVDNSAAAVAMTRQQGGAAIRRDLFAPLPAEGCWEQILLADGNIGIGGDPVRTLTRAANLLAPGGIVIAEIDPPSTALSYELLRWETEDHVGRWFPWSRVGAAALRDIAYSAGFVVTDVVDMHTRVIAVLTADDHGKRR